MAARIDLHGVMANCSWLVFPRALRSSCSYCLDVATTSILYRLYRISLEIVRIYPENMRRRVLFKAGESVCYPRASEPGIGAENMPGERRNHAGLHTGHRSRCSSSCLLLGQLTSPDRTDQVTLATVQRSRANH